MVSSVDTMPCVNSAYGCDWRGEVDSFGSHSEECKFALVPCGMEKFGCKDKVFRKDLDTHMKENVVPHLTHVAQFNFRLTSQLQQDLRNKDKAIAQLRRDSNDKDKKIRQLQENLAEKEKKIVEVQRDLAHIEGHLMGKLCDKCTLVEEFKFEKYSDHKSKNYSDYSRQFYSQQPGCQFKLCITYYWWPSNIAAYLYLLPGEYDDQLLWPVSVTVRLELLNQARDRDYHHVENKTWKWEKYKRGNYETIANSLMYSDLEKIGDGVQYMMNDCLKFRLHFTVQAARLL